MGIGRWLRSRGSGRALVAVAAVTVMCVSGGSAAIASSGGTVGVGVSRVLSGTVPKLDALAHRLGALPASAKIKFLLPLRLSRQSALNAFVTAEYTPGSSDYRDFLKPSQFGERFGASDAQVVQTVSILRRLGFSVSAPSVNHLYVSAVGTVAAVEKVFGTPLVRFQLPAAVKLFTGPDFYANTSNIKLPASLSGLVTGVIGLNDSDLPQPQLVAAHLVSRTGTGPRTKQTGPSGIDGGVTPCPEAVASGGYTPPQLATGYDFNGLYAQGFHGEGMTAALVEFDDFHDSNVATVESCYGVSTPVTRRLVDGGTGGPPGEGEAEDMADITTILGLVPKLAHLYVYEAPITGGAALFDQGDAELDLYNAFVTDDLAPVLSASWGSCEEFQSQGYDQLFGNIAEEAAAQGQQIFDAAGDSGAVDCEETAPPTRGSISVEQEAAVPWITGVGGTDLSVGTADGTSSTHNEDTWNDAGAGGGGQSVVWTMPAWQQAYLAASGDKPAGEANDCGAPSGDLCRMVPDISMNADPDAGGAVNQGPVPPQFFPSDAGSPGDATYCGTSNCTFASLVGVPAPPVGVAPPAGAGDWYPIGGTSLATPTAASAAILWDQEAKKAGLSGLGFLNPILYRIASNATDYAKDFHNITTGSNDAQYDTSQCPTGCNPNHLYAAGPGYNMASGLGSIDASNLGADLVKDAGEIDLTPSTEQMYGYTDGGPTTTQPVSVTSGYRNSTYTASSNASWLHVGTSGTVPSTLSWYVDPTGLSAGSYAGQITVTGEGGSTATLTVDYSVGPRATISASPGSLKFTEQAISSSGTATSATCGSTTWGDELASELDSSDTAPTPASTLNTLSVGNSGPADSTLHYEVSWTTDTSSWLTQDMNPDSNPSGFQTTPSQPLVPTSGSVAGGTSPNQIKLASVANANAVGGYPRMNQGTYTGEIEIRDLADPSTLVTVPVTLVLGTGDGTPTIAASPSSISVSLAPGKSTTEDLVLSDSSKTCGYAYSLGDLPSWASVNPYLMAGTVAASPATSAPASPSDTGSGNGYTPITISTAGLSNGTYHGSVTIDSQNAVTNPTVVPLTLTVGSGSSPGKGKSPKPCKQPKSLTFVQHPKAGVREVRAVVYVNGKVAHRYSSRNIRKLTFARPKATRFTLKIVTSLSDGEQVSRTVTYNGCTVSKAKVKVVRKANVRKK